MDEHTENEENDDNILFLTLAQAEYLRDELNKTFRLIKTHCSLGMELPYRIIVEYPKEEKR